MNLHLSRVAFGAATIDDLLGWFAGRGPRIHLTTRYQPKRHVELVGGSLYWIIKHQLVARAEIVGFAPAEAGRTDIVIANRIVRTVPQAKRAHQGWRYLDPADAPADLTDRQGAEDLPAGLAGTLAGLGLL